MDETNNSQTNQNQQAEAQQQNNQQSQTTPAFDYDLLAGILAGRQAANAAALLSADGRRSGSVYAGETRTDMT